MCCPICGYEMRPGQTDCPRCSFRRAVGSSPSAMEMTEALAAAVPTVASPPPVIGPQSARPRRAATVFIGATVALLLFALYLHQKVNRLTPREAQIQTIFTASDGPCRQGDSSLCMASVQRVRALGDLPDGALLLGDCNIARYLHTQPGGAGLAARWRRDEITVPELSRLGNRAYAQGSNVYRSFWMYAQVKRDHIAVPQFIFSGAGS